MSETEYYDEDIFVYKYSTNKYKCIHCLRLPKHLFRCKCATKQLPEVGKGKRRYEDNTGISCSDCINKPCTNCGQADQYEKKNNSVRQLKVHCKLKCGETITLNERDNHVKNKCSKRVRNCIYRWAGCEEEKGGEEMILHEQEPQGHTR